MEKYKGIPRICTICGEEYKDFTRKGKCKKCSAEIYRNNNRDKLRQCYRNHYYSNKINILKQQKQYYMNNQKEIYKRNKSNLYKWREKILNDWKEYFQSEYGDPYCEICGRKLIWFSDDSNKSVNWDHKEGYNDTKAPGQWIRSHACNLKNVNIWKKYGFGLLCRDCNKKLPTKNRMKWLTKVLQYMEKKNVQGKE